MHKTGGQGLSNSGQNKPYPYCMAVILDRLDSESAFLLSYLVKSADLDNFHQLWEMLCSSGLVATWFCPGVLRQRWSTVIWCMRGICESTEIQNIIKHLVASWHVFLAVKPSIHGT